MTLKIMDAPPIVGSPAIAHLCDVILESSRSFGNAAADFTAFRGEVQTLRRFLDLIERIRQANAPRTSFEDEHFSDVEALLERCRDTLKRLCEILADLKAKSHRATPQDALQQALRCMQDNETVALRGRIAFYVQCLQMSLHVVKLVYQWKSQPPQGGISYHHKALSEAIQALKESVSRRKGLTQRTTQYSPIQEEVFLYDLEKCIFSAEVIMSVTTTTVYENLQPSTHQMPCELPGTPADEVSMDSHIPNKPPRLDPPRLHIPKSRDHTPERTPQPRSRERSPMAPQARPRKPVAQRHIAEAAIRPKASNPNLRPKASNQDLRSKTSDQDLRPRDPDLEVQRRVPNPNTQRRAAEPPLEKPIMFHLDDINAKHRGSFDSETDSIFDPEPEFEDRLPDAVYSQIITGLQQEVQRAMQRGDYQKAEVSHRKAMEYLTDRERKLGVSFDTKKDMQEILAEIYVKQKELNKAKKVLNRLLMEEKEDSPRKWRLYHTLANVYQEQDRLTEAEKFAKRAYIGREKSLMKHDSLVLESVELLINVYERQHKIETAEALKKVYQADFAPPQVPPKSRQRDRAISQVQPRPESPLGSPPGSPPGYQPRSPAPLQSPFSPDEISKGGKSQVRWAPDVWVDASSINAPTKSGETPLISAINTGDDELVRLMLSRSADVEARCVDQITPLMHAVSHGFQSIVEILINKGAQVEATTAGWTALARAADMVNIPIAKMLLVSGADIEARSPKEFTPKRHPLARMGGGDLEDYDEVDASEADIGWTALLRAATNGQEAMVRLLVDRGADIEAKNPSNGTPLICAAEGNQEAIVDFLLGRGADVNAEDEFGWKPLHRVLVSRGGERVAQMLLTHGAQLDARCNYHKTPLHHAIEKGNDPMVSFLLQAGSDYEARDIAERTPLHTAIEARRENMVRILLEAGADADAKDRGGRDALAVAQHAPRKSPEVIGLLSKHKKDKKALKRGSVGSRQASISGSSVSRASVSKSSVSRSSSSSWWGSVRSKKDKK